MAKFCLGYTHEKCDQCQHSDNWRELNLMADDLRRQVQVKMHRVDSDQCRMTNMGEFKQKKASNG